MLYQLWIAFGLNGLNFIFLGLSANFFCEATSQMDMQACPLGDYRRVFNLRKGKVGIVQINLRIRVHPQDI